MQKKRSKTGLVFRWVAVLGAAAGMTLVVFLMLPIFQKIAGGLGKDRTIREVEMAQLPPPPPPPPEEEEPEPEEEEEPPPPQLDEEPPPLTLDQLELALNSGMGGVGGDFGMSLNIGDVVNKQMKEAGDKAFSMAELDKPAQAVFQGLPVYPPELQKKKLKGRAIITFIVGKDGRVQSPKAIKSDHPAFGKAAVDAVRKWKFEPGERDGKKVAMKMKVPISFVPPS
ncbi:MAG: energy transducer TonB [Verrucomicrobiota bacterium]